MKPVLCRPLIKGTPCYIIGGQPHTAMPGAFIRGLLSGLPQFVGVLVAEDDEVLAPRITFWVYDVITTNKYPLHERLGFAQSFADASGNCVQYVDHQYIKTKAALKKYTDKMKRLGYEDIVMRDPNEVEVSYEKAT